MEVATKEHQQKGVTGAVGAAIRLVPPTVLSPVIIATEATSNVLGGMRNQLQPDARKEDEEKWKGNQTWGLDSIDFDWQTSFNSDKWYPMCNTLYWHIYENFHEQYIACLYTYTSICRLMGAILNWPLLALWTIGIRIQCFQGFLSNDCTSIYIDTVGTFTCNEERIPWEQCMVPVEKDLPYIL